jgi:hypothetical protein
MPTTGVASNKFNSLTVWEDNCEQLVRTNVRLDKLIETLLSKSLDLRLQMIDQDLSLPHKETSSDSARSNKRSSTMQTVLFVLFRQNF